MFMFVIMWFMFVGLALYHGKEDNQVDMRRYLSLSLITVIVGVSTDIIVGSIESTCVL